MARQKQETKRRQKRAEPEVVTHVAIPVNNELSEWIEDLSAEIAEVLGEPDET